MPLNPRLRFTLARNPLCCTAKFSRAGGSVTLLHKRLGLSSSLILMGLCSAQAQDPELRFPVSEFGTPGLLDMPTGEVFEDGMQ